MNKYTCTPCGWEYDPAVGDPDNGIAPGTPFEDLCTMSELQEMSRRMQAAKMLRDGYIYNEIASTTGLSTATISRVNRCLKYSSEGYLKVLDDIDKADKRRNLYDSV